MNNCISELPIGEILVRAGLVTQSQMDEAVKEAGTRERLLGKTLVGRGVLTNQNLRAALAAQSLLRDGVIDSFKAFKALSIASADGLSFEQALVRMAPTGGPQSIPGERTSKLGELLQEAGIISEEVLDRVQKKGSATGEPLGVVLVSEGLVTESFLDAALELQVRVRDGMFSRDQAIFALRQDPRKLLDMIAPHMMADEAQAKKTKAAIRLGELLVRAGIISNADVNQALELSLAHGHQIGEMLVARGFITRPLLDATLSLQQMATLSHLTTGEATACLVKVFTTDKTVTECILELNSLKTKPALRQAQRLQRRSTLTGMAMGDARDTSTELPALSIRDGQVGQVQPPELYFSQDSTGDMIVSEDIMLPVSKKDFLSGQSLQTQDGPRPQFEPADKDEIINQAAPMGVARVADLAEKIRQIQIDTEELRNLVPEGDDSFENFEPTEDEIVAATRFEEFFGANFAFVKEHRESFYRGLREAYARLGRVFLKRRKLGESEDLLKSALELSYSANLEDKKVEDLMFLACLYLAHGKSWQSERLLKSCLAVLQEQNCTDSRLLGLCHHRLALVYCHLSLLFKAEKHFKQAIEQLSDSAKQGAKLAAKTQDTLCKRRLASVYRDYAVLLNRMRREQEADRFYSQARKILSSSLRTG